MQRIITRTKQQEREAVFKRMQQCDACSVSSVLAQLEKLTTCTLIETSCEKIHLTCVQLTFTCTEFVIVLSDLYKNLE